MNIEETQKEENFEHEVLDRLKCLDPSDFDYNAVDGSYVDAVLKARDVLLTAYEKEKEKNKELNNSYDKLAKECNEENRRCMLLAVENQDFKEKNKELEKRLEEINNINFPTIN